ncbi:hypothetical protein Tco_1114330 [Tanacetum coccineum]|uniref:Zinc finger, CCHC-type, retrotransposon Gag domain protein n=1 Tax=Tanacetum coccineum TaxID=301880 RepID=A0ABQ5IX05_9ASTR
MDKKKCAIDVEVFCDILQICPKLSNQEFDALPSDEEIVSFIKELGHKGNIKSVTDMVVDQMHQPWRTFASIINKCPFGKITGLDRMRLLRAQILWGMFYNKNVNFVALLWEDIAFQIENRDSKKQNKIILGLMRFVSKSDEYQVYGALLLEGVTNQQMQDSPAYKTYLVFATRVATPKKAKKFMKPASPSNKKALVDIKEPAEKPIKRPAARRQYADVMVMMVGGESWRADGVYFSFIMAVFGQPKSVPVRSRGSDWDIPVVFSLSIALLRNKQTRDDDVPELLWAMITAAVANALPNLTAALRTQITNDIRNGVGASGGGGEDWITHMEKLFQVLGCPDNFKTRLAAFKLEGDALSWWKGHLRTQYGSIYQLDRENSGEYMERFTRLASFVGATAGDAQRQARHFKWGLKKWVLDRIVNTDYTNVARVRGLWLEMGYDRQVRVTTPALYRYQSTRISNQGHASVCKSEEVSLRLLPPPLFILPGESLIWLSPSDSRKQSMPVDFADYLVYKERVYDSTRE